VANRDVWVSDANGTSLLLKQVGWQGPYGTIPGGMDVDPLDGWKPLYVIDRPERKDNPFWPERCPDCNGLAWCFCDEGGHDATS
jgi:hypothetical protein